MTHTLPVNQLLQNRYVITRVIGQGGFGITYEAQDEKLNMKVCIKELFIAGSSGRKADYSVYTQEKGDFRFSDFLQRFVEEARQLAKFDHPNIVKVKDVFQELGTAYMVMEFVEGETLKQKINTIGPMSSETALPIFHQLLDAIEKVHEIGMLHRDIKPENILIRSDNRIVLIDFGSARDFTEGKTLTQTAILTPGYAPMEQYGSKKQRGAYTDIYALGATLYFMLTGTKPMDATDRYSEEMQAPHELNPAITSQLSSVVLLAMQMKPEDRFQSVKEFRQALEKLSFLEIEKATNSLKDSNRTKVGHKGLVNDLLWVGLIILIVYFLSYLYLYINELNIIVDENPKEITPEDTSQEEPQSQSAGMFQDSRDGETYPWVKIGNQIWMAENLRYNLPGSLLNTDNPDKKYGRSYTWEAAMQACPPGWHLPSDEEWNALTNYLGTDVGKKMKSQSGWDGNNSSGFNALPAGHYSTNDYNEFGSRALFWSSTEQSSGTAMLHSLFSLDSELNDGIDLKYGLTPCRCLKD